MRRTVPKELIEELNKCSEISSSMKPIISVVTQEYLAENDLKEESYQDFINALGMSDLIKIEPKIENSDSADVQEDKVYKEENPYSSFEGISLGSKETVTSYLESMRLRPQKISTGIPELDEVLGGGYRIGINIIGGVPNLGKTTLLINSAVNMAKQGTAAIYLTHDMRSNELIDKVFSKVSYDRYGDKGFTLTDISYKRVLVDEGNQKSKLLIKEVMEQTGLLTILDMLDTKDFITMTGQYEDLQGLNVIERAIKLYTSIYQSPVFFVDSLQQMALYLGLSAKDGIDKILMMFKEYSAKYKAAIVLVSTLSRTYYNKDLVMEAFKESGNIEYDADSIFVLQPKFIKENPDMASLDDFKNCDYRDITIKCLKSRDSGFASKDITLFAPFCSFIPYDEDRSIQLKIEGKQSVTVDSNLANKSEVKTKPTATKPKPVNTGFVLEL